jgi:hypothetical protein
MFFSLFLLLLLYGFAYLIFFNGVIYYYLRDSGMVTSWKLALISSLNAMAAVIAIGALLWIVLYFPAPPGTERMVNYSDLKLQALAV